ncbi:MAG: xanthine phosphoribosyltransferase [Butyricicoccaceae bacterium]
MELLKQRILQDGEIRGGNVLKVDSFLNHQLDIPLFEEIGQEFQRLFADKKINKILTIESSGIAVACIAARYFNVPVVFAKKTQSINIDGAVHVTRVQSVTTRRVYEVIVSKKYLGANDHVLIIDDFLANGCAAMGLIDLARNAGATIEGFGVVIEKSFQQGGKLIRADGVDVRSLVTIDSLDEKTGSIVFRD